MVLLRKRVGELREELARRRVAVAELAEDVTREQVAAIAADVECDMIYFLKGRESSEEDEEEEEEEHDDAQDGI